MNEIIEKYNQTQLEIRQKFNQIRTLQTEIIKLQKENKAIEPAKKQAVFELVVENIEIGEIIKFGAIRGGGLRPHDKVKIVRKNKKSVTVDIFNKVWNRATGSYIYNTDKIKQKRIPSNVFGEHVINNPKIKQMIDRNEKLKALLEDGE